MPLTTCKKCAKICSSTDAVCPYCGASFLQRTQETDSEKQHHFRVAVLGFFAGFFLLFVVVILLLQNGYKNTVAVAETPQNCLAAACPAGTKAVTDAAQQKPYYTCKNSEFSDYANFVLNVMVAKAQMVGLTPQVSSKTGEPVVEGKEKAIIDKYRANAGVATFEEAISKCYKGIGMQNVIVLYYPADSDSIYVAAEKNQEDKFWLPKARLNKMASAY